MASAAVAQQPLRGDAGMLLLPQTLGNRFHFLFDVPKERQRRKEKKKSKKKNAKQKGKDKSKSKREKSPEKPDLQPPHIELHGNPSAFAVYWTIRQAVLEHQSRQVSQAYTQAHHGKRLSDSESEDDDDDEKLKEGFQFKMPKIVSLGLVGVFELIRETRVTHPGLCTRSLQALLDMVQGQQPEGLKAEPAEVIDSLYLLLMDLATTPAPASPNEPQFQSLTALACSCLLSLVVARGDTGKILSALAAMLMSPSNLSTQEIKVPSILTSLQRSIHAVLLGRTNPPDWLSFGVTEKARMSVMKLSLLQDGLANPALIGGGGGKKEHSALASDGKYLYIHNCHGLHKIGSGYSGTIKGHLYLSNSDFHPQEYGWLAYAKGQLYYRPHGDASGVLTVVTTDNLMEGEKHTLEGKGYGPNVMFSDGENMGHVAASKDDSFVVRTFSPICNPMPLVNELPLKLARKCLDVFGTCHSEGQEDINHINTSVDEEIASISAGKGFALLRTPSGKVLYTGRSQALGIKQGGPAPGKWAELPIIKSPKIVHYSVGHEGSHALLVAEDGSVFFVGTPKRGEDGDGSKARRPPKAVKPKKMIKLEGKHIVYSACNSGTSAMVTKDGELYMFGKDTLHCDTASGIVTELRDVAVAAVALGKAHAVVQTSKGQVFTFGINNKGQCGRDYVVGATRETSTPVTMVDEEEADGDCEENMCSPGKHRWHYDECMVCALCGECTGYGNSCVNSGSAERNAGLPCGCGSGDAGCAECGVCRNCAGEQDEGEATPEGNKLMEVLARSGGMIPFDVILGRQGARNLDQLSRRMEEKRQRGKVKVRQSKTKALAQAAMTEAAGSDAEQEHIKITTLPPARIIVSGDDVPVTQTACGLHHTVLLLENGEVYTFGSNHNGQLGLGDTNIHGTPTRVPIKASIVQIAAGNHHTCLLTASGQVFTFGSFKRGQLGRNAPEDEEPHSSSGSSNINNVLSVESQWFATPGLVPGIGAKHGRRATWIGASGDRTFIKIDESLINAHTLSRSTIVANPGCIGLIPTADKGLANIRSLMINRSDGSCRNFTGQDHVVLTGCGVCLDPVYDILWSYSPRELKISCYSVINAEARNLQKICDTYCNILNPELAMPNRANTLSTRSHSALYMLGCLDSLTTALQLSLSVSEEEKQKAVTAKIYTKEDYSLVNRFESNGGGWGYSGHSIEAIRFMVDTDVLLGGFGLFGGRGDYFGKIKVFELGPDGGDHDSDGELVAETEESPYECGAREKFAMLLDEPVALQANHWYVAWSRISGPSSDCGSGGQASVSTEDQVVFKFKSSKKSNNGTDVNAGQIPQILYRLPSHDTAGTVRKPEPVEPAHILSRDFSKTVSPECFEALLKLLNWSWHTFCAVVGEVRGLKGTNLTAALMDLERLVFISAASLRLLRTYICEVFPNQGLTKKTPTETSKLAECVGDTRSLLKKILSESKRHLVNGHKSHNSEEEVCVFEKLADKILEECHQTFTVCFHAFYPTGPLKWSCLCELLGLVDLTHNNIEGFSRLLAAVMEALCHATVKLSSILPINCEHSMDQMLLRRQHSAEDNNTNNAALHSDQCHFPLLVTHMVQRSEMEGAGAGHWSFREVMDKLLTIAVLPVRQALNQDLITLPPQLVANTCSLLAAVVSELAASATGAEVELGGSARPMLMTPNRFTRTSQGPSWNTGNGNSDAACFSVDRPGIIIAGVAVYGGTGQNDYELELLDDQSEGSSEPSHTGRWNTLETVKGAIVSDDCINDIAEIKFDRPMPIKENVKYAIRLRNKGPKTFNGDGGMAKVKCPDGAVFAFSACSLSNNGTNHVRGQIPQILYFSAPQEGEGSVQNSRALAEYQSRKNVISITSAIFKSANDLLHRAQGHPDPGILELLGRAHIFSTLLPMTVAYIGPVAAVDPRGAVQVLGLVQELLPPIASLCRQLNASSQAGMTSASGSNGDGSPSSPESLATSQHYAVVESDHPYKPATVANYKVTFPGCVKWMVLEFDATCGTAQVEDTLQLFIPSCRSQHGAKWVAPPGGGGGGGEDDDSTLTWWPVLKKFHGSANWPAMAVILPGNKVCFSLETASDYVKDDKACYYGFKCTVVGYEWTLKPEEGIPQLEKEVACLGGMCAASLMRKDIMLPSASADDLDDDLESIEEGVQQIFNVHANLLGKGFALAHSPTIAQALEGNLPFSWTSNERAFLKDFVNCAPATSGSRLAAWLQPESYLDPKQCEVVCNKEDLRCNWPTAITVCSRDQYGHLVNVPNLKVEVKAIPIMRDLSADERRAKRMSRYDADSGLTFGGHPPPKLETPYQVTVKDKKDAYHAICMMKSYENYSFEELRFAAPVVRRQSENMLVRANNDGTYNANWTPGNIGWYKIQVMMDGYDAGETMKVEVKDPPQGMVPPSQANMAKKHTHHANKMRKFVAPWSAGLRVRINPSLQSEQVGVIKPDGIISFVDELHNDDGVWVRLSPESMKKWCSVAPTAFAEAWALQYNQHLGKTLLVPVDEPKSILDELIKETLLRRLPELVRDSAESGGGGDGSSSGSGAGGGGATDRRGGPGVYHVVKCGSSGHNIRCRPSLKSTPVGMLVMGNQLTATECLANGDGLWVKLDESSLPHFCHEVDGDAWTLAKGQDDIMYLQHEAELADDDDGGDRLQSPFSVGTTVAAAQGPAGASGGAAPAGPKGFDFTTAQQTPSFAAFGAAGPEMAPGTFPVEPPPLVQVPTFGRQQSEPLPSGSSEGKYRYGSKVNEPLALGGPPRMSSARAGAGAGGGGAGMGAAPKVPERKDSLLKDLPPELQGISVKDLVKALGESRVNGNGVTPPRTPPGTPKKTLSRSSSPNPSGAGRGGGDSSGGSPQPQRSPRGSLAAPGPGISPARSPPCTPPCTPPMARRSSAGVSSLTTPPNTPPSLRKDYASGPSPGRLVSPSASHRSSSSSPQRSPSPLIAAPRPSSASPIRTSSTGGAAGQTDSMKGHFSIGTAVKEEARLSPKASRKDRSKVLKTKRERALSPAPRPEKTSASSASSSRSGSLQREKREKVKEAMAPSVAQCIRAVFAGFMWHEGIVHDAMACASFLKFHPNLPKELPRLTPTASSSRNTSRSSSKQSTPSGSLKKQEKKVARSVDSPSPGNININEAVRKLEMTMATTTSNPAVALPARNFLPKERHHSESKASDMEGRACSPAGAKSSGCSSNSTGDVGNSSSSSSEGQLPPTLKHLVYFWEEMSTASLKVISQKLILPSPAAITKIGKGGADKGRDKDKDRAKKDKKKKDNNKYHNVIVGGMGRGNLFGEAAGGLFAGMPGDKETVCELCGGMFPHPVTYHMRKLHPGCGRYAGGQGYNSGGNFCGGWAGNCGDGGIGGSTWYLMCDRCRDKYLREKRQVLKEKSKRSKKKSAPVRQTPVVQMLEPHMVMKNNAMFLLDLASSASLSLPSHHGSGSGNGSGNGSGSAHHHHHNNPVLSPHQQQQHHNHHNHHHAQQQQQQGNGGGGGGGGVDGSLPSVNEALAFPLTQFLYLVQRGAHAADSAFAEDVIFSEGGPPAQKAAAHGLSSSGHFERVVDAAAHPLLPRIIRSGSMGTETGGEESLQAAEGKSKSAQASPCDSEDPISGRQALFQRSISEIAGGMMRGNNEVDDLDEGNEVRGQRSGSGRRRNNSGGMMDGGMSLLKHPSGAMSKLIQSVDRSDAALALGDRALHRPVMMFVMQRHDLDGLQLAMKHALRKAACRVYALQAFNWLVRSVTQPVCLHDLIWLFVASLTPTPIDFDEEDEEEKKKEQEQPDKDVVMCDHPLSDIAIAGEAVRPLQDTFHTFLQTISDAMMYLPPGTSLQQMAVRCWCLKFKPLDHIFLHKSHVFSNISKILSKSDEGWGTSPTKLEDGQWSSQVESLKDLTPLVELKASSRQAMIASLTDNSTETFWESGDEDRNKTKTVIITCGAAHQPKVVYVHVDNTRDLGNKVTGIVIYAGQSGDSMDDLKRLRQVDLEPRHSGWVSCNLQEPATATIRLEMRGPDNTLRLRQVKLLGTIEGSSVLISKQQSPLVMQQKNCEMETLKVFRLLTSQVFGRLISDEPVSPSSDKADKKDGVGLDAEAGHDEGDVDLKEHMVSILFSRSKLTHLQKQVCAHIVQAIRKETIHMQEAWEDKLQSGKVKATAEEKSRMPDAYCFELLSMVLALSGSAVGRAYLAQQHSLLQDLIGLLHTASPRVQRQVTALLRRVLPDVQPQVLATLLGVTALPPQNFSILSSAADKKQGQESFDPEHQGLLDVFLACIAKALTVQRKVKGHGSKGGSSSFKLSECLASGSESPHRWWLRGHSSSQLAETIIALLKDLASGAMSESWAMVTKGAIAENILALTKLDETMRSPNECIKTPTLWLALASLCVLNQEHVERLSSGQWVSEHNQPRPTCDNHDDSETLAIILCSECGNLCADCDRFLHLHRKTRAHQRQVFKEEEEAIRVDLHEGCGRTKLFWVMALADARTLKAMVEFRDGSKGKFREGSSKSSSGTCRFCGAAANTGLLSIGNVCSHPECQEHAQNACGRVLACGHPCCGVRDEEPCLQCLHGCQRGRGGERLKQDADDMCMICFTEALSAAPAIQLTCGHVFHLHCCRHVLEKKWVGPRITFGFSLCPICKCSIEHPVLCAPLKPLKALYEDVKRKALMRLEYEGLHKAEAITSASTRYHQDPEGFAMDRYAYYVCFKCNKAYYGGEARCEEQAAAAEEYDPSELVCGACSDVSRAQICPKHGTDFLEYKCRYCCSVAVFFCFGTTHFCNACHDDFQRVTNLPKNELPHCPTGPRSKQLEGDECPLHVQHPPTGEEFALGCGVCRNAHTF